MANWSKAIRELGKIDPVMKRLIREVGPCTLSPHRRHFVILCKSIFSQQLNTTVAAIMFGRFAAHFPRKLPTPEATIKLLNATSDADAARTIGLSRQKKGYILDLAKHFADGRIPTRRIPKMSDDEVVEALTEVKGIGRWTAEMFMIFTLNRPDIWPVDDLGLQESYRLHFGLKSRPKPKQLIRLGERFRPWRSIATWYLWRGLSVARKKK